MPPCQSTGPSPNLSRPLDVQRHPVTESNLQLGGGGKINQSGLASRADMSSLCSYQCWREATINVMVQKVLPVVKVIIKITQQYKVRKYQSSKQYNKNSEIYRWSIRKTYN